MVIARNSREVFDYVLRSDQKLPADQQTTFHLKRFPTHMSCQAAEIAASGGRVAELALRYGIAGWSNFNDKDGNPVECKHETKVKVNGYMLESALAKESLEWLSADQCVELLEVIRSGNTLTDDDVKN